jgi:membrane peptidoglycan carboxypeptidase
VSQYAKDAAVDGEDRRFYEHGGVDPTGVVRALVVSATGGSRQGASTIAQQLVKNILIQQALQIKDPKKSQAAVEAAQAGTIDRKLKEMKLAISLEKKYTKNEILLAYLNIAAFGGTTYGIQAAAERYYGVSAKDLNIEQAASLIAIVQKPSARAPLSASGYVQNQKRRDVILTAMHSAGDITLAQRDAAIKTPVDKTTVHLSSPKNGCIAASKYAKWFCDYVTKLVPTLTSLGSTVSQRNAAWETGGYKIYTSLNLSAQAKAQNISWQYAPKYTPVLKLGEATTSVEVGTGRILTMAENKNFNDTGKGGGNTSTAVNFNTNYEFGGSQGFQGGSTYKAFTLIDWLNTGHGINQVVNGSARTVDQASFTDSCGGPWGGPYPFHNDAVGEAGPMTVANATANSVNGAFISMGQQLDLCDIKKVAESLGVRTAAPYKDPDTGAVGTEPKTNPSSILGTNTVAPLTMAAAYAGIAAGGKYCEPTAVDSIVDPNGKTLGGQPRVCTKAISSGVAHAAIKALEGVLTFGTGGASNPHDGNAIFAKTGTTNGSVQTWTVGSTSRVATAVWVGNIRGTVALRAVSISGMQAAVLRHAIFSNTMRMMDKYYPAASSFPAPPADLFTGSGKPVQNVIGQSINAATNILEANGFKVQVGPSVSSSQPAGTVAKMNPGAGSLLSSGYIITLNPSKGDLKAVPNVIGDGNNSFSDAQAILSSAGFTNVVQGCRVTSSPSKFNKVIGSDPHAGDPADPARKITVDIGQAKCP